MEYHIHSTFHHSRSCSIRHLFTATSDTQRFEYSVMLIKACFQTLWKVETFFFSDCLLLVFVNKWAILFHDYFATIPRINSKECMNFPQNRFTWLKMATKQMTVPIISKQNAFVIEIHFVFISKGNHGEIIQLLFCFIILLVWSIPLKLSLSRPFFVDKRKEFIWITDHFVFSRSFMLTFTTRQQFKEKKNGANVCSVRIYICREMQTSK